MCTILSMFGVFFTNFAFSSYVFFMLIFFLEDPNTYQMSPERALSQAAWLLFIGYPFNLVSSIASGYLFVRLGRKKLIAAGFIIGISSLFLVPYIAASSIYPNMFLLVAAVNIGTAWTQNPPLIADYIKPSSIGKAYAIQGLLTFMATIFAVAVLFGAIKTLEFKGAILIVCPILYLLSFLSICGLKEIKSQSDSLTNRSSGQQHTQTLSFCRSLTLQLRLLFKFSQADCSYNVSYLGYFVSEMGYLLSFVYINAWTSQFFMDQSESSGLEEAKALSETITTTSMVIGLFVGLLLGHFIDRCRIGPLFIVCF